MILNKIKIGWKIYEIIKADAMLNNGADLAGQINYDTQIITLRKANTDEQNAVTLIHEALHGISEMYGLNFEESIIERLGNAIYILLVDNSLSVVNTEGH